jgi:hypothetical protein
MAGLAVHGVSIICVTAGLVLLARASRASGSGSIVTAGTAIAVVGLFTVFPLFPAGLPLIAWGLRRDGWPASTTVPTMVGGLVLSALAVARYVAVGAPLAGEEGAPDLSAGWVLGYLLGVGLVTASLLALGWAMVRGRGSVPSAT